MRIKEDKLFPENLTQHLQPGGVAGGEIYQQSTEQRKSYTDDTSDKVVVENGCDLCDPFF